MVIKVNWGNWVQVAAFIGSVLTYSCIHNSAVAATDFWHQVELSLMPIPLERLGGIIMHKWNQKQQ